MRLQGGSSSDYKESPPCWEEIEFVPYMLPAVELLSSQLCETHDREPWPIARLRSGGAPTTENLSHAQV